MVLTDTSCYDTRWKWFAYVCIHPPPPTAQSMIDLVRIFFVISNIVYIIE